MDIYIPRSGPFNLFSIYLYMPHVRKYIHSIYLYDGYMLTDYVKSHWSPKACMKFYERGIKSKAWTIKYNLPWQV